MIHTKCGMVQWSHVMMTVEMYQKMLDRFVYSELVQQVAFLLTPQVVAFESFTHTICTNRFLYDSPRVLVIISRSSWTTFWIFLICDSAIAKLKKPPGTGEYESTGMLQLHVAVAMLVGSVIASRGGYAMEVLHNARRDQTTIYFS